MPVHAQWTDEADVRRTIEDWRAEWGVPGAAVAVVRRGEVLLVDGFGVRRLGAPERVDRRTLFELGSASKTFIATAAALAVDEGHTEWTTRLTDLLPTLRLSDPFLERHLTLLDVLSHRTGFGGVDLLWLAGAPADEIVSRFAHIAPSAAFRDGFSYSNLMYILAGEALANLFGQAWDAVVEERVVGPIGVRVGHIGRSAAGGNAAVPHIPFGDSLAIATTPTTHAGPAGGLLAGAEDLVPWMRFHLDATGSVRELQEPRVSLPLAAFGAQYARASRVGYGTGWFVSDYAGRRMVDHIGGHGGMVANISLLPDDGIGVAVLANHGDNLLPVAVTYRILDLLLGLEKRAWNRELMEFWDGVREMRNAGAEAAGGVRAHDAPARLPLSAYVATYTSPVYGDVVVEADGVALGIRYGANLAGRLSHWHHDTFRVTWSEPIMEAILGRSFLSFHLDMAGRPSGISLTGFRGERLDAARAPDGRASTR